VQADGRLDIPEYVILVENALSKPNHMKHTTPVEVWIPRLVNGDLFVHGSPLAGCDTSPEKKWHKHASTQVHCLLVPMDRRQNRQQVSLLNSLGQS
jgi:hypothetical protein